MFLLLHWVCARALLREPNNLPDLHGHSFVPWIFEKEFVQIVKNVHSSSRGHNKLQGSIKQDIQHLYSDKEGLIDML